MKTAIGIQHIFGGAPMPGNSQKPEQQQQQTQQQPVVPESFAKSPNQDIDPNKQQQEPKKPESPLDPFADLFTMPKDKDGKPVEPEVEDPDAPFLTLDSDKLREQVSKMSFLSGENVDSQIQKALGGDVESFKAILQGAVQNAYLRGAELAGTLADRTSRSAVKRMSDTLPQTLRKHSTSAELAGINPVFNHPAMEPIVNAISAQISQKFPEYSAKEVAQKTNDYLRQMSVSLTTDKEQNPTDSRKGEQAPMDFGNFFNS